jgi:hypothetical protein
MKTITTALIVLFAAVSINSQVNQINFEEYSTVKTDNSGQIVPIFDFNRTTGLNLPL